MRAFLFCSLVLLCSLSPASLAEATKTLSGFSVDLIHRDSTLSPFYNPSLTPSERIKNAALRSIARSKRIGLSRNEDGSAKTITIRDKGNSEYLLRFYIGTPPVERFAIADTGSDLIWVQCSPCAKCLPQNAPLFDPRKSSTFRRVRCDSQPCTLLPQRTCGNSGECKYSYGYADKSYNNGILGVDKINFGSKGVEFPKFTFGCAYYNNDTVGDKTKKNTGLVGLGAGPLSLVSQLGDQIGPKFSYCLLPFDSNSTSKLKFGNEATIKGKGVVSTPLILKSSDPTSYYLNLEGISFGQKVVKTSKSQTDGNIVIDSGTALTILERRFYNKVVTLVKEVLGVEAVKSPPDGYDFCFNILGANQEKIYSGTSDDFPPFVFHFTGAKVRLGASNLFVADGNSLCLLIRPTDEEDGSIFGNIVQMGFQVEYDLERGKVSFAPADCAIH